MLEVDLDSSTNQSSIIYKCRSALFSTVILRERYSTNRMAESIYLHHTHMIQNHIFYPRSRHITLIHHQKVWYRLLTCLRIILVIIFRKSVSTTTYIDPLLRFSSNCFHRTRQICRNEIRIRLFYE